MKSNFQKKDSAVKQIEEDDREDDSSASGSGSGCVSESDGSSTFSDESVQCKIRKRRSGSIIKFSPSEFRPPVVHGEAKKTSEDEIRVPLATNKTSFKTSFSNQVNGTPTMASEKSEVTADTPNVKT